MIEKNELLNFSKRETLSEEVLKLSETYKDILIKAADADSVYRDENTGHYRLTSDARESAHKIFDGFFEQAGRNHQLLRLAVDAAYKSVKVEIQQDQPKEKFDRHEWALLRTAQSIQGVNTWLEASELYTRAAGQTSGERGVSAASLYQEAKKIRTWLESRGIPVYKYLEGDVEEIDKTLRNETEKLDGKTSTLLGRALKKIRELKQKVSSWLPKKTGRQAVTKKAIKVAPKEEVSSLLRKKITRRQFLKGAGATVTLALGPITVIGLDPEFQAGVEAAFTRPEMQGSGKRQEVSLPTLFEVYRKHFRGKEHLLPEKVWARIEGEGINQKIRGTGAYLAILASLYYESERREGENFDTYYARFVDTLRELSDIAGLNFITLVSSLQISAENIAGFEEPKDPSNLDVNVSRIQEVGITAARALGLESSVVESLGIGGPVSQIIKKAENVGITPPLKDTLLKEGIRHYDLIRFREQPTTGLMDFEPGERAEALMALRNNPLSEILRKEYPQIYETYKRAYEKRGELSALRRKMESAAKDFIERFDNVLRPFTEGDEKALNVIGISPNMDPWQLLNYTDVWYKASELPTYPEFAYQRTIEYMKKEAARNPSAFYRRFFSQQIRNPKFIEYLIRHAKTTQNQEERITVLNIQSLVRNYEQKARELRIAHLKILGAEGPYEYDSRFQLITSILVTKRLSDIAGPFNPNDRNSLGWHIYKVCAAREIAPIPFLVDEHPFACDITIDPPYAAEAMIESLETFARMLQEAGILEKSPDQEINLFYRTMEKMFWRDGGVWFGPKPNPEEQAKWQQTLEYFNTKIANRLFYDFVGLLHDEQKINKLNAIMMSKRIIPQPANKDPYNFFTQFVYLALDSWHMRRDIPKPDWDEVEIYFRKNIMPMVITRKEIAPGIFKKKWNIGSADYPPIFRCQAVMYNFLIDQNPEPPSSTSSDEVLGHY